LFGIVKWFSNMFTRQFFNSDPHRAANHSDPVCPQFRLSDYGYGKQAVRVFQLRKTDHRHEIIEYLVTSYMRLRSHKEYYDADNSDIVGSDVQQTNIYMQAQEVGLTTPEEFALHMTKHFLENYEQAVASNILVEENKWARLGEQEKDGVYAHKSHNHVFLRTFNGKRYCEVVRTREDSKPVLISGIKNLRMVKTANAPFTGYVKGSLYVEGDNPDRILCVELNAKWQYTSVQNIDFAKHWYQIRDIIIQSFAGDIVKGITTTSVQYVAYQSANAVLSRVPEICSVSVQLLNFTHLPFDFSRFSPLASKADVIISDPADAPCSVGYAQVDRKEIEFIDQIR